MKVFTTRQIREIDACTIGHEPVASIDLMERASVTCTSWLTEKYDRTANFVILAGPGNNGGDGWAIARLLAERGNTGIRFFLLPLSTELSSDSSINRQRLIDQNLVPISIIESTEQFPVLRKDDIVIDALFGSGFTRPLSGLAAALVKHVNLAGCTIIAIDIPSGLMGEDNSSNTPDSIIRARHTLTFQFPKLAFFFGENEDYTGEWKSLNIGLHDECIKKTETPYHYINGNEIARLFSPRKKFSHKGTFGHALLIAGSNGMMGAAVLASKACLRSGAGLVSTHVPSTGYPIMQSSVPESIVSIDQSAECFSQIPDLVPYNALGVGPGIGTREPVFKALKELFSEYNRPMVIDADALNLIAAHNDLLGLIPENSILTPHPKEFERLAGIFKNGYERLMKHIEFARNRNVTVVLKGANTAIAMPDGNCYFNSTGNPGMATGGSGDVLTGIILSLLAQGYEPSNAALAGVYIHGLAGDIAAMSLGQQALIASDIIDNLGNAFMRLEI
jgi:hydroxyethylthiazole kinase-like uncharacterized protein yjeF